jgi:predicted amidophosphoribosyltransferase
MLAVALGRLSAVPVDCFVLKRVRRTASQVGLTADQRRRNVSGAFRVDKDKVPQVKGRGLRPVLKRAGAARVDVLALARVVEPTAFVL